MTLIAKIDTFTNTGRYVPRGGVLSEDEIVKDDNGEATNTVEVDDIGEQPVVEISAIAPTGPNPKNPQQLSPTGQQTVAGYVDNGAKLIGEVTLPEKERRVEIVDSENDAQSKVADALAADTQNHDDALVEGTVADVTKNLGDLDADALDRLEAAEKDREQPRVGVLSAIEKERASRQSA